MHLYTTAMDAYELKHNNATSAYAVPEGEQVGYPTENHELAQLGYKPELEVLMPYSVHSAEKC